MTDQSPQTILVFGATGGTGKAFVEQALLQGHSVIAFVRDPSKLPRETAGLKIIEGDLFDADAVKVAVTSDCDAVFTAYGFSNKGPDNKHERVTRAVVDGMMAVGVSRLVAVSSMGASESQGIGPFWVRFVAKVILKHIIPDKTLQETVIKNAGLTWTVLRPPMLVSKPATGRYTVWAGMKPPQKVAWKVARADVAAEGLRCIETGDHGGEAVQISW
ncbi:MAG: NAD(P)H-binding protein [Alphaproteobacteria bacterium]|nr:NAD(P)H-binding protein [Alphaproteobacteria bacterium]